MLIGVVLKQMEVTMKYFRINFTSVIIFAATILMEACYPSYQEYGNEETADNSSSEVTEEQNDSQEAEEDSITDTHETCGNGIVEGNELCDGNNIACSKVNYDLWGGGDIPCKSDCSGFDYENVSQCQTPKYKVDRSKCYWCGYCAFFCPQKAISDVDGKALIDPEKCNGCGICAKTCGGANISRVDEE